MKWLGSITNSMDINLSKLLKTVKDRGAWHTTVHESYKELDMTEQLNNTNNIHNTKASTSESESLSVVSDSLQSHGLYSLEFSRPEY